MTVYLDTSFLVSLYVPDANTAAALRTVKSMAGPFPLTAFCELELTNAVKLRVFRHEITAAEAAPVLAAVREDLSNGLLQRVPTPSAIYEEALRLSRRRTAELGTRTLDILHVAAAITLGLPAIYTFDKRQAELARAEGMATPVRIPS